MELWSSVLHKIREKISAPSFETWFSGTNAEIDDDTIIVYAQNQFAADWLECRYKSLIFETVRETAGQTYDIWFAYPNKAEENCGHFPEKQISTGLKQLVNHLEAQMKELYHKVKAQEEKIKKLEKMVLDDQKSVDEAMFIYKIDDSLSLKRIELKDAERVFELTNTSRDYLKKWLPWLDTITKLEDTINFIKKSLQDFAEKKSLNTVILYHGKIVGVAGFNRIHWPNKTAYIGYWLGEEYQGNGIMTKVVKALTDYAFSRLNLNKVEIRAAVGNKKSRSIPERLNFVNEGCIRQAEWLYDHYVDHVIYGILAEEWRKINNPF